VDNAVLLKASGDGVVASAGLDYLSPVAINVVPEAIFWEKCVCTFRLHGSILSAMKLEFPDLQDCYALSKVNQNDMFPCIINYIIIIIYKS